MSTLKCIINYLKNHILIFILTIFIILLSILITLIPPQILKIIIDDIIPNKNLNEIFKFSMLYMSIFISIGIINFLKEVLLVIISQGVSKEIRINMLNKIHRISYLSFIKYDSGSLESYFSNDVEEINALITSGVISMIIDSFKIIGIIISIFLFSYLFGIITLLIIPIIIIFSLWIKKRMYKAQASNRALEGNVNGLVLEAIDNISSIKAFRIYDKIENKYNNVLINHFKSNQLANTYDAIFSPIMQIFKTILIALIICLSNIDMTSFGITIGMLVSSIDLITNLFSPIENLGMELQTIQKSMAAINRIDEFFKIEEDDEKRDFEISNDIILEFKNVTYSYDGINNVIENFNLKLKSNDHLALMGKSGSGKSTIFKLAYGLIKPTKGSVEINGIEAYLLNDRTKAKIFGIAYQSYFFSGGTIKEEITLLNDIDDKKIYETLHIVGLDRIKDINIKLNEDDYSTGELALLNIARIILLDSRVIFLDEMNSKIDFQTANKIIKIIDEFAKNKIVLSISHYGNLLKNSKIINIDKNNH